MWTEADQEWLDASLNLIDANRRVRESERRYRWALIEMVIGLLLILVGWALFGFMLVMIYAPSVAH